MIIDPLLTEILFLLGLAVLVVVAFRRLHIPPSLGYLLVGVVLGPHTIGPIVDTHYVETIAEFGIVFLLFTIGLNYSLPQINALRGLLLGLGIGQVLLTTVLIGAACWFMGLDVATAFVVGAVFAQSSTTIISKQLSDQGEDQTPHGRLGVAISVFQDVTAVPLIIIIMVLGSATGLVTLAGDLGLAVAKVVFAFILVVFGGRWLLQPLFRIISQLRSAELFTLTVLFVSLLAAWITNSLGLSMAIGAFMAGMMLGETEFRHQVEATIRPFRDVLLGLFFVSIGMLFDPVLLPQVWPWALAGAAGFMIVKILLVAMLVWWAKFGAFTAWRTGILLAVGGEFGFALLSIALGAHIIDDWIGQILLMSVLFSIIAAPFLIRYNHAIAAALAGRKRALDDNGLPRPDVAITGSFRNHVIICGYGRIGQSVGNFLKAENIPFLALDLDAQRVRKAHDAGSPVYFGDAADADVLEAIGLKAARMVVISHNDHEAALKAMGHLRHLRPDIPIIVRTRDETHDEQLRQMGATEVIPETLAAGLTIASRVLLELGVPQWKATALMQEQHATHFSLMRELFIDHHDNNDAPLPGEEKPEAERSDQTL